MVAFLGLVVDGDGDGDGGVVRVPWLGPGARVPYLGSGERISGMRYSSLRYLLPEDARGLDWSSRLV